MKITKILVGYLENEWIIPISSELLHAKNCPCPIQRPLKLKHCWILNQKLKKTLVMGMYSFPDRLGTFNVSLSF